MPTPSEAKAIQAYQEFLAILRRNTSLSAAHWIQRYLQRNLAGELFQQLDLLQGWLASFRPIPAAVVAELDKLYDVRFTYHSNAIEGNTLTQSETEMVLEKGITVGGKSLREHLEAVGHREAIHYIRELAASDATLTERVIRDLHSLIMRVIEPEEAGRYRTLDVRAAGTEHLYPAHYHLPELMQEFAARLASSQGSLHPVLYASQAHYRFVAIHPFRDGNGRTGRLLMNLLLLQKGYPITVLTSERRSAYIDSLVFAQTHQDDTEPLTKLVAAACQESLVETLSVLATAAESQGKGLPFYEEMLRFA